MTVENHIGRPGVYPAMDLAPPVAAEKPPMEADPTIAVEPAARDFATFYRDQYQTIARALSYTLGDVSLATEAADEGMARACSHWSKISRYDNPGGWVYRVALNWARSFHRRAARVLPMRERPVEVLPPIADPAIGAALRELEVKLRAVVVCRLLLDWSVDDTATALGIKPGTVKSRLHHALRELEPKLGHLR